MAKHSLSINTADDQKIIGISTLLKDYKLAFFINEQLQINLSKLNDFNNEKPKGNFSFYYSTDPGDLAVYNLISNRKTGTLLVAELKQADYFLLVKNILVPQKIEKILSTLKKLSQLQLAFEIMPNKIKGLDYMLEQFELHEMNCLKNQKK